MYDLAANEVLPVPLPAFGDSAEDGSFSGVWLDADRLRMWGVLADRPLVSDVSTREATYIDAPFTGPVNFTNIVDSATGDSALDADGVSDLYMVRNERQGDLWLVELGERSDAGLAP